MKKNNDTEHKDPIAHKQNKNTYEYIQSALNASKQPDGLNAILKFFKLQKRIDTSLPFAEQLELIKPHRIMPKQLTLDDMWYKAVLLPMLVKAKNGHMLAVLPAPGGCCYVENGKKKRINGERSKMFTHDAICFYRIGDSRRLTMPRLIDFILGSISVNEIIIAVIACAFAVAASMTLPWINNYVFKYIIPSGSYQYVSMGALILAAVTVIFLMGIAESILVNNTLMRLNANIHSAVFSRLLSLRSDFFKTLRSGELSRIVMEIMGISKILSAKSIVSVLNMLLSLIYLVQIHYYAPQLTGFVLIISVLILAISVADGLIGSAAMRKHFRATAGMSGFAYELFSGIRQIKLNAAEKQILHRWSEHYLDVAQNNTRPLIVRYMPAFNKIVSVVSTAVIFVLGAQLYASNYIAFSIAYGAYMAAFSGAAASVYSVFSFRSLYMPARPMLDEECEKYYGDKIVPVEMQGRIKFSNVTFSYEHGLRPIIDDMSFEILPGESIGIVGHSGSGKSTLIRLLLGFEMPDSGSIQIDNVDLREIDLRAFRSHTGTVLQNSGLISGDIYANITISRPDASLEEVLKAAELAGLAEDLKQMPMGLHTPVGIISSGLVSGGQLQRILIARALLSNPSILIFDEATSSLDNISQAKVTESINSLSCTKIIVAHRLSTIENCDRIIVIDNGKISAEGTYEDLQKNSSLFNELMANQRI